MSIKRIHRLLPLAVLAVGLALAGCDSNSPEDDTPSIGGMYVASETVDGTVGTISLDIPPTETGTFTLGEESEFSAVVEGITLSAELTGTGSYDFPDITMTLSYEIAGEPYTGQVSGTVSGSGDILRLEDSEGEELSFTRQ